ncbi:unnamed protein product [Merluccius merluccius]
MNSKGDWLVENKGKIEQVLEIMGQTAEILASTVGQLHPILEAVFEAAAVILSNPEGKEAHYLTEKLVQVSQKLGNIQDEVNLIHRELQISSMNKQNFDREAQMLSQYEKFLDFVNAKPEFKVIKKDKFLSHYENTDGDLNVDALYNAVTGNNIGGVPMLETLVSIKARSRRAVEDFCARLKKLFIVGIFAIMGHAALKEGKEDKEMVTKWQDRMEEVEKRMKAAVDNCIANFAEQAKIDMEHELKEKLGSLNPDFGDPILEFLVKKYDWISWSIRKERIIFFNWLAGKSFHGRVGEKNYFDVMTNNKFKVVVSFCVEPKPIDRDQILKQIDGQKLPGNMINVAETLSKSNPDCLVHAVSKYKEVVETNNFQPECYYFAKHKQAFICIHPI